MKWQDIILWILFALSIAVGLWYLFGNSPTFEQALLVVIITFLFKIQYDLAVNKMEMKNFRAGFIRLAEDFKKHIADKQLHK